MKVFLQVFVLFAITSQVFSQNSTDKKYEKQLYSAANEYMYEENYKEAQETYLNLIQVAPNNDLYLIETGLSYFFAPSNRENSLKYFELAKQNSRPDTLIELYYYLGRSYQLNSEFTKAITNYEKFKTYLKDNKTGKEMKEEVDSYIRMCQHGQYHLNLYAQNPVENADKPIQDLTKYFINDSNYVAIENLGAKINSPFSDYTPITLNNNNYLAFTSRRNKIDGESTQLFDGQYFEKIYVSRFADGEWKQPVEVNFSSAFGQSLSNPANDHNAIVYINQEEKIILTYSQNKLSYINRVGDKWSKPVLFDENINVSDGLVSSAAISNDGKSLYVVCERKDGYGGRDIYFSEKQEDGSWSELKNLGATINTEKDEETPYISQDNKKLYFASQGHSSMGGYDIFVSEKDENNEWKTPTNLGVPINSPADEIYYFPRDNGKTALYSSSRPGGYGDIDLYTISKGVEKPKVKIPDVALADNQTNTSETSEPEKELAENIEVKTESEVMEDEVAVTDSQTENVNASKEIADNIETEVIEDKPVIDEKESLKSKEQDVEIVTTEKPKTVAETKETTTKTATKPTIKSIPQDILANLDFGFNASQLSDESKKQLQQLANELKANPNVVLTVNGHADYLGTNEVNQEVSKQRALMVYNYLIEQGTQPNNLRLNYFGEEQPLVDAQKPDGTDIPENRAKNRRVEFETKEFKLYRFVLYGFDSYALDATANNTLNDVVAYLKTNPNAKAQLNGYTDKSGNVEYNKYLSGKRVNAVFTYLTKAGVPESQLEKNAFGIENPAIPDGVGVSQKYNRRVEILVN